MRSSLKLPFTILCAVPFIMVLGNSMLIPLLPQMRTAMDLSLVQVGLLITAFSLPAGVTIPFAGFLSDRTNRKLIMAPALIIYGFGGLLAGLAALLAKSPYYLILGGRLIQGFGAGGTYQLAMALTGDIFQTKERTKALGLLEASNGLGKVVSPIAGAALGLIAWSAPFFAYGILAIPIGIAVWLLVKEPRQETKAKMAINQYFSTVKQIFREKGISLLGCFLSGMMVLFILFGVLSYVSDVLEARYEITGLKLGLVIAIPVSAMALTSYFSGNYLQGQPGFFLKIAVGCGLMAATAALVVMAFRSNTYLFFLALTAMGIGNGLVLPAVNTLITSAAAREERGIITCLYGSLRFFGVALGPPAFGLATDWGRLPLFLAAASLVALTTAFLLVFVRPDKILPPEFLPRH